MKYFKVDKVKDEKIGFVVFDGVEDQVAEEQVTEEQVVKDQPAED